MKENVSELLQAVYSGCEVNENLGEQAGVDKDFDCSLQEQLQEDLSKFAMYLSASDGTITATEASFISELCGQTLSASRVKAAIHQDNIYSVSFESTPPPSFAYVVDVESELIRDGDLENATMSRHLLYAFNAVGRELVWCDGEVTEQEEADFNIYMNMLWDYAVQSAHIAKHFDEIEESDEVVAPPSAESEKSPMAMAMASLADMLYESIWKHAANGEIDQAKELLAKRAKAGDTRAQYELGLSYLGKGRIPFERIDEVAACTWLRKAAEAGHEEAGSRLGYTLFYSDEMPRVASEIIKWMTPRAEKGDPEFQNAVGVCYASTWSDVRDNVRAVAWFRRAAERGYPSALLNLGDSYKEGQGVAQNTQQAKYYLQLAVKAGSKTAVRLLQELEDDENELYGDDDTD